MMARLMVRLMTLPTWAQIGLGAILGAMVAIFAIIFVPV